jgi:2-keto-4-pentenoate hydratase/2-oxohepta-3-ene-1,7-dioic acid hydratase in catechol pathway
VRLLYADDHRLSTLRGDEVVDVSSVVHDIPHVGPGDLINGLIARFDEYRERLEAATAKGRGRPLASVRIRAPLPKPTNIICIRVNFRELLPVAAGQTLPPPGERTPPQDLDAFLKAPGSVIGPGDEMILPDIPATIFEGEAELGVVIGKRAANVSKHEAMKHVFGYTGFIDGSARGLRPHYQMKSRVTFAPIGPFLVTPDEIPDPHAVRIRLWNNGDLMQDINTEHLAHDIPTCIAFASSVCPLEPGDIIATGTDHGGLHAFQDGDVVELGIDDDAPLRIRVRDDLKRTWSRETRADRYRKSLTGTTPQLTGKHAPGS